MILKIIAGVFEVETSFAAVEKYECWSYKVNNGEVTITDCIDDTPGAMVIPDTIEGYPVTAIDSYAFLLPALVRVLFRVVRKLKALPYMKVLPILEKRHFRDVIVLQK